VKKLLIIQQDEAYFLFETIQVLEKNLNSFKDFQVTVLVDEKSMSAIYDNTSPFLKGITSDEKSVLNEQFDLSVNLSLNEKSWDLHDNINSFRKVGTYKHKGELIVEDLWTTYLLTLKARAPYLTFHLQDVYKNILGIKGIQLQDHQRVTPKQIAFGTSAAHLFPVQEQENFLTELSANYPGIPVRDISEIDLVEDVSATLFIGPATLTSLKFAEAGGRCIFLTSAFQGFNLLPHGGQHIILSTRGSVFRAGALLKFVENDLREKSNADCPYSMYTIDQTVASTSYVKSLNKSDDNYPFYQSHVVLWNFLLNLSDVEIDIVKCTDSQISLLKTHHEVLTKFIRLHDYAMASVDTIHVEAKAQTADAGKIDGHIKNLQEIEKISDQIAASHALLRPFLDFYRIRRGQNFGSTLLEQAQSSFLTYAEEHQALKALQELFSVTLRKNEVNI
jgi:hypothetical protein